MESIVNSIISSYLADYLEINPEKTKLSVLSGTVDLYGVKFKKNLFTTLNLPYLELVDGYIGKIHIDLSLPRFYLYPINVFVDKIYVKVKPRNMLSRRIKAVVMTLLLVSLFIFLLLVPVFGSNLFGIIMKTTGNSTLVQIIKKILMILKYPLILVIIFINIKIMYIIAPDQEIPSKTANKGAIFTTVGWILSTEIFAFYIEKFTKYDIFYGSISNILVLLLWVYLLSYIFVLGMVINASNYKSEIE